MQKQQKSKGFSLLEMLAVIAIIGIIAVIAISSMGKSERPTFTIPIKVLKQHPRDDGSMKLELEGATSPIYVPKGQELPPIGQMVTVTIKVLPCGALELKGK